MSTAQPRIALASVLQDAARALDRAGGLGRELIEHNAQVTALCDPGVARVFQQLIAEADAILDRAIDLARATVLLDPIRPPDTITTVLYDDAATRREVTIAGTCREPGCGALRLIPVHHGPAWTNPICGHLETLTAVLHEAAELAAEKGESR